MSFLLRTLTTSILTSLIAFLTIFIIGAVPALIFIFSIWKRYLRLMLVLLLILIILGAVASVYLFYGGGFRQLGVQLAGAGACFAWAFILGLVMFNIVKKTVGLRTTVEEELKGLDIGEHGMEAYNGFQIFTTT